MIGSFREVRQRTYEIRIRQLARSLRLSTPARLVGALLQGTRKATRRRRKLQQQKKVRLMGEPTNDRRSRLDPEKALMIESKQDSNNRMLVLATKDGAWGSRNGSSCGSYPLTWKARAGIEASQSTFAECSPFVPPGVTRSVEDRRGNGYRHPIKMQRSVLYKSHTWPRIGNLEIRLRMCKRCVHAITARRRFEDKNDEWHLIAGLPFLLVQRRLLSRTTTGSNDTMKNHIR